jgi:hypothetical protein
MLWTQWHEAKGTTYSARIKVPEKEAMLKPGRNSKKCNVSEIRTTSPSVGLRGWFCPEGLLWSGFGCLELIDVNGLVGAVGVAQVIQNDNLGALARGDVDQHPIYQPVNQVYAPPMGIHQPGAADVAIQPV